MTRSEALRAARARVYVYRRRHGEYIRVSPWDYRRPTGPLTEHAYTKHLQARRAAAASVATIALHLLSAYTERAAWLVFEHSRDPWGTHDAAGLLRLALADGSRS